MRTQRLSLKQLIYCASAVLIVSMAALAVTVWVLLDGQANYAQKVKDKRVPQLQRIADIELNVTRTSLHVRHAMLARTPQELSSTLASIQEQKASLDKTLAEFGQAMSTPEGRQAFEPLPALMAAFWRAGAENIRLIEEGKKDEAFAHLLATTIPARNQLLGPLAAENARQGLMLDAEIDRVAKEAVFARNLVLGMVLLVSAGMIAFSRKVIQVMGALGAEPEELKRVASAVAAGDLSVSIELQPGDSDSALATLKTMSDKLAHTVRAVRRNAENVASASLQIAGGNADLSRRTEQQAGSLEQTAASMDQFGASVRQNADNARQANELAITSSTVAGQGGEMVREVVGTMKDISESSRKISDIIGVIDGIAFQTNILALNAAVEAARAGEQGRGFAVVASEVRSLAQRSASAAREIKALISASVERVEKGAALVDRTGATMQDVVASIRRVTEIVGEISAASSQQSESVAQVGRAVSQMDQVTQQNAALVEESAASSESLKEQAQQLVQAVAVFKMA